MSAAIFQFDPRRGGFCLQWANFSRERPREAFAGLLTTYLDENGLIAAIESFWDHGGLPLCGIHQAKSYPVGDFPVAEDGFRAGPLRLVQTGQQLELWFGAENEPLRDDLNRQDDRAMGMTIWFGPQKAQAGWPVPGLGGPAECPMVAGFTVEFARTVAAYPISSLRLSVEDFK